MTFPNWLQTVHHDGSELYVSHLTPKLGDTVTIRLRTAPEAPIEQIYLCTFPDGEQRIQPMHKVVGTAVSHNTAVQWWEIPLQISQPVEHYRFLLAADDGVWAYTAAGPTQHMPLDNTDFRILADYEMPAWLETAVFYQIFPDRFANGDPHTNPLPTDYEYRNHHPQTYEWGTPPDPEQPFPIVFYGGDLPGIVQHLDYLERLGVNAIYLNPIFTAYSNHKYDVIDYDNVDPHFGGNDALVALREALTTRHMRYILDIVPNHCGYWHPWFQRARQNIGMPSAEFFTFHQHPDEYESWLGVWTLPKLNYKSWELRRRIYEGDNAVFRKWLRPPYAADGWRVDVANMLGRQGETQVGTEVVEGIRQAVKQTSPAAYLMGENFFDATPTLQGNEWDGVMNYTGLTMPLFFWLRGFYQVAHGLEQPIQTTTLWPTTAMVDTWTSRQAAVPWVITRQQYNLLGSHDIPRLRTILAENEALQRLALIVLFTFPGVPGIYYGDEIGMVDDDLLAQRGCMVWDESQWNVALWEFNRALIQLRRESAVLQRGGFQMLAVEADTIAYQRESADGRILVIAHRAETARPAQPLPVRAGGIADGTRFVEFFTGLELVVADGALPLPALSQGATLLQAI